MKEVDLKIAVVIPTYNRREELSECLASLSKSTFSIMAIIVVDNGSNDGTIMMLEEYYPNVVLLAAKENLGATVASNLGFAKALDIGAEYILRLDSDTIVAPDLLWQLVKFVQNHPDGGIFSPKIYHFEPSDVIWYAGAKAHRWHLGIVSTHRFERDNNQNSQAKEVDYVWAAAMLISKEVLLKVGGFDTDFFVYHEELDFCIRVKSAGFSIWFVPDGKVWHRVGLQVENNGRAYNWNRSKIVFYRKHAKNRFHLFFLILSSFLYTFLRSIVKKPGSGNRGSIKDAMTGLINGITTPLSSQENLF